MSSHSCVVFPVKFTPGDRVVVPSSPPSCEELVITCKAEVSFETVDEFYSHCLENKDSPYFAYTLRRKPS